MSADILGLFEAHGLKLVKKTGSEWAAPCPACGGEDRCMVRPGDHGGMGGYWCRQCETYGDAIQFLRDFEGMSYAEACQHLGMAAPRSTAALPRVPRPAAGQDPFEATPSVPPAELWSTKATAFAAWAHQHLLANPIWLSWLAARGLPLDAVVRYRLGWNPGDKGKSCLIRPRASWGLPPLEAKPGQDKPKTTFWLPRGLVIPQLPTDPDGPVLRLRVRRPDEDRQRFGEDKKYYVIPGSSMDAMILAPESAAFVVVESELDALMLHHQLGDLIGVVSVQTANVKKIAADVHAALARAKCILVALDAEGAGGAGAKGWQRWAASFPRAKRWPCPVGKDPGEAFEKGANLRAWVLAGLPPAMLPGRLPTGQPPKREGGKPEEEKGGAVAGGVATEAPAASAETAALSTELPADGGVSGALSAEASAAAPAVRWLDPDYVTALDMVPLGELLAAMATHRVEPVLVAGLAAADERVLALWPAGEVPAEAMARVGTLFFGECLEAVLWFARLGGLRAAKDLVPLRGRPDAAGETAAIVRRLGAEPVGLAFAGWTSLDYWRGREAARR